MMLTLAGNLIVVRPVNCTVYLNRWAVEIYGGSQVANYVAEKNGFRNLGQVGGIYDFWGAATAGHNRQLTQIVTFRASYSSV